MDISKLASTTLADLRVLGEYSLESPTPLLVIGDFNLSDEQLTQAGVLVDLVQLEQTRTGKYWPTFCGARGSSRPD